MIATRFTRLLGASAPVQLAAMPGVVTPALVRAVADAGGVGMIPATMLSGEELASMIDEVASGTDGAFGVNFLMPFLDPACLEIAARRVRLVEFFYGEPDAALVERVHAGGALAAWQVGSASEASVAERAGCDLVIAQGTEAGGHVRGRTSLLPLLAEALETVSVPVVAAGGIATGRELAAVLACGASGARLGTRFVASTESGAHPDYVRALLDAAAGDTCLTEAFSVLWPDAPHRVLRSAIEAAEATTEEIVGETPRGRERMPIPRFAVICPSAATTGRIDAMALYAGESVSNVHAVRAAADIVAELVSGAEEAMREAWGRADDPASPHRP